MSLREIFNRKQVFSYEVFPPRKNAGIDSVCETIKELKKLNPDFISVTYGAIGARNNTDTFKIASLIKSYGIESITHLPCLELKKEEVLLKLEELRKLGINNILALRGDKPEDGYRKGDFKYASDLITFIKEHGDFNIIAACYPEKHSDSKNIVEDVKKLKIKVDAGANQLITQLFLDNDYFYAFKERCELADINVPIEAGIMPVVNKRQIEKMTSFCKVETPKKFLKMMNRYEHNKIAMRDAGIAYAIDQIADLITQGVDGIHLYTMNNPYVAKRIHEAINNLLLDKTEFLKEA